MSAQVKEAHTRHHTATTWTANESITEHANYVRRPITAQVVRSNKIGVELVTCLKPLFHGQHIVLDARVNEGTDLRGDVVIKVSRGARATIDVGVTCLTSQ